MRMRAPEIETSTMEERERFIHETFRCKGDCDNCGFCAMYHGKSPETVYDEYIKGTRSFMEITQRYRQR